MTSSAQLSMFPPKPPDSPGTLPAAASQPLGQANLARAVEAALAGATVVTANARAARAVRRGCDVLSRQSGPCWPTADALPFESWIARTWTDALAGGVLAQPLLRPAQELALWRGIMAEGPALLGAAAQAESVAEAWRLLRAYELPLRRSDFSHAEETRAFFAWAADFQRWLREHDRVEPADAAARLADIAPRLDFSARGVSSRSVVFFGFDDLVPQQRTLLAALEKAGLSVTVLPPAEQADFAAARRIACPDARAEMHAAARWARRWVEAESACRVGIVVPDLASSRALVEQTLLEVLAPEALLAGAAAPVPFDVALGPPLAGCALVNTALLLLKLVAASLPIGEAGVLLRSPHLRGGMREAGARSLLEVRLRRYGGENVALPQLLREAPAATAQLRALLIAVQKIKLPARLSPAAWARFAAGALAAADWPGERALDSSEFQTHNKFLEQLSEFAALEGFLEPRSPAAMLEEFSSALRTRPFRPENSSAPVQVLGWLEASGECFDHLWVCGLSDQAWPPARRASQYLPIALQRAAALPGSSHEQREQFAARLLARLTASAPDVIFSHAQREADGELRPAAFLAQLCAAEEAQPLDAPIPRWQCFGLPPSSEPISSDEQAPAIAPEEVRHGGTELLKLQSNCPFWAFAKKRLGARPLEEPELGLRARDRGDLVERAIGLAWEHFRDHANLASLTAADRQQAMERAVQQAMSEFPPPPHDAFAQRQHALERARLIRLLDEWFQLESQRVPCDHIEHKVKATVTLAGLELRLEIDRLDRVAGEGSYVVIDYKSGDNPPKPNAWRLPRPRDPQLPIYTTAQRQQCHSVAALAFARPVPGQCSLNGYGERPELLAQGSQRLGMYAGRGVTFAEHILQWEPELERLASDFLTGNAAPDPRRGPTENESTCERCPFPAACRIAEHPPAIRSSAPARGEQNDEENGDA